MKRILALILALVMVAAVFAGCSGSSNTTDSSSKSDTSNTASSDSSSDTSSTAADSSSSSGEKKQITMWFWGAATDYQTAMKEILCGWYNSSQDEYELSIEFRNTVDVDIPRALAAGNAPDIVYASGPSYTSTYVQEGLVLNLDAYSEQYGWKDRVLGAMYDCLTVDGSLYSTPGGMCVGGLFYNTELFEEQGWIAPTTWDEMLDIFEKAKAAGIYPLSAGNKGWKPCNDHFSSMIINHAGGAELFYNALTGKTSFNTPEMVEAVQLSADWYAAGYLAGEDYVNLDSQEVMQLLGDKRCAMVMAPTLYIQFAGQLEPDVQDKIAFIPMPSATTSEAVYDLSVNCNFSINATTPYADECAKILDYMLTADYVGQMTASWPGYWAVPIKDIVSYDASSMSGMSKVTMDAVQGAIEQIDKGYFAFHPTTFFPSATVTAFEDVDTVWQGVMTAEQFCEAVAAELDAEIAAGMVVPLSEPAK